MNSYQSSVTNNNLSLICENPRNPWFPFLNKQTQFQNQQNYDKSFNSKNYEPRTTNWRSQKRTQSNPILSLFPLWQKKAKNGAVWDKFGVFLAHFGVIWAQFGVVLDKFGNTFPSKNRVLNTENHENTSFRHLDFDFRICFGFCA